MDQDELLRLGFKPRYDSFISYTKLIDDLSIHVYKHIQETKWICVLIDDTTDNEISVSYDCDTEFAISLMNLLEKKK